MLESELQAAMRPQGLASYDEADLVVLETDGSFTVVRHLPNGGGAAMESLTGVPPAIPDR